VMMLLGTLRSVSESVNMRVYVSVIPLTTPV